MARKTTSKKKLEPLWAPALMTCWEKPQKLRLTEVLEDLKTVIPPGITMPTYNQARRYLVSLRGGLQDVDQATMTWEQFFKEFEARITEHNSQPAPFIRCFIDTATRQIISFSVSQNPSLPFIEQQFASAVEQGESGLDHKAAFLNFAEKYQLTEDEWMALIYLAGDQVSQRL
jgi:hypothetical protein